MLRGRSRSWVLFSKRFVACSLVAAILHSAIAVPLAQAGFWNERRAAAASLGKPIQAEAYSDSNRNALLARLPAVAGDALTGLALERTEVGRAGDYGAGFSVPGLRPLSVPTEYLNWKKSSVPPGWKPSDLLVLHIQDVHLHPEAQENISRSIADFVAQGRLGLVALEGAFAPLDVSRFRAYRGQKAVSGVADYLLGAGKISGAVHAAFTAQGALPAFAGVDDGTLYSANVRAYLESRPLAGPYRRHLQSLERDMEARKRDVFHPRLRDFDGKVAAYREGRLGLADYLRALSAAAGGADPDVRLLLRAAAMESGLDFARVESERARLVEKLAGDLSRERVSELLDRSLAYRLGRMRHADFYAYLRDLAQSAGCRLEDFPAMAAYIRYVLLCDRISAEGLLRAAQAMEARGYEALAETAEEKDLAGRARASRLVGQLLDFSLTPEDWSAYLGLKGSAAMRDIERGMDLSPFEGFFREAAARDRAMASKLLSAARERRASVCVLVAGGFHSSGIERLLLEQKAAVVTLAPKIGSAGSAEGPAYLGVFAREKTPLEKLFQGEKLFLPPPVYEPAAEAAAALGVVAMEEFADRGAGTPRAQDEALARQLAPARFPAGSAVEANDAPGGVFLRVSGREGAASSDLKISLEGRILDWKEKAESSLWFRAFAGASWAAAWILWRSDGAGAAAGSAFILFALPFALLRPRLEPAQAVAAVGRSGVLSLLWASMSGSGRDGARVGISKTSRQPSPAAARAAVDAASDLPLLDSPTAGVVAASLRALLEEIEFDRWNRVLRDEGDDPGDFDYVSNPFPTKNAWPGLEVFRTMVSALAPTRVRLAFKLFVFGDPLAPSELEALVGPGKGGWIADGLALGLFAPATGGGVRMNGLSLASRGLRNGDILYVLADTPPDYDMPIVRDHRVYLALDSYQLLDRIARIPDASGSMVEAGSGSGIQLLAALKQFPGLRRAVGFEIDRRAIHVSRFNARLNGVADRLQIVDSADALQAALAGERAALAVMNPPFMPVPGLVPVPPEDAGAIRRSQPFDVMDFSAGPAIDLRRLYGKAGWGGEDGLTVTLAFLDIVLPLMQPGAPVIIFSQFASDKAGTLKIDRALRERAGLSFRFEPSHDPSLSSSPLSMAMYIVNLIHRRYSQWFGQARMLPVILNMVQGVTAIYRERGIAGFTPGFVVVAVQDREMEFLNRADAVDLMRLGLSEPDATRVIAARGLEPFSGWDGVARRLSSRYPRNQKIAGAIQRLRAAVSKSDLSRPDDPLKSAAVRNVKGASGADLARWLREAGIRAEGRVTKIQRLQPTMFRLMDLLPALGKDFIPWVEYLLRLAARNGSAQAEEEPGAGGGPTLASSGAEVPEVQRQAEAAGEADPAVEFLNRADAIDLLRLGVSIKAAEDIVSARGKTGFADWEDLSVRLGAQTSRKGGVRTLIRNLRNRLAGDAGAWKATGPDLALRALHRLRNATREELSRWLTASSRNPPPPALAAEIHSVGKRVGRFPDLLRLTRIGEKRLLEFADTVCRLVEAEEAGREFAAAAQTSGGRSFRLADLAVPQEAYRGPRAFSEEDWEDFLGKAFDGWPADVDGIVLSNVHFAYNEPSQFPPGLLARHIVRRVLSDDPGLMAEALEEAIKNAVIWGNRHDSSKSTVLRWWSEGGRRFFDVIDQGTQAIDFNARRAAPPDVSTVFYSSRKGYRYYISLRLDPAGRRGPGLYDLPLLGADGRRRGQIVRLLYEERPADAAPPRAASRRIRPEIAGPAAGPADAAGGDARAKVGEAFALAEADWMQSAGRRAVAINRLLEGAELDLDVEAIGGVRAAAETIYGSFQGRPLEEAVAEAAPAGGGLFIGNVLDPSAADPVSHALQIVRLYRDALAGMEGLRVVFFAGTVSPQDEAEIELSSREMGVRADVVPVPQLVLKSGGFGDLNPFALDAAAQGWLALHGESLSHVFVIPRTLMGDLSLLYALEDSILRRSAILLIDKDLRALPLLWIDHLLEIGRAAAILAQQA